MKNINLTAALSAMSLSESMLDIAPEAFVLSSAHSCVCGAVCEEDCVCKTPSPRRMKKSPELSARRNQ